MNLLQMPLAANIGVLALVLLDDGIVEKLRDFQIPSTILRRVLCDPFDIVVKTR